ncbi:hypothetical protein CHFL109739_17980 [Chryseobacterium flavum]
MQQSYDQYVKTLFVKTEKYLLIYAKLKNILTFIS